LASLFGRCDRRDAVYAGGHHHATGIGQVVSRGRRYTSRNEMARRLQLPPKLMAQPKFGTRRRAMLSFERQPFPAPCHVDQDIAHSRAGCALGHLTTFDRVLSALHHRNHLPLHRPLHHPANAATAPLYGQHRFAASVHSRANSGLCPTPSSILDSGQAFRAPVVARIIRHWCVNQQDGKLKAVRPSPRTQQPTFSLGGQQRAQARSLNNLN
jgi:hypothetical protein